MKLLGLLRSSEFKTAGGEKSTARSVLNAHAAVSVVLIVVAAILYAVHSLDLSTTLGLIGIAITLVGGNATAVLAAGKYADRKTAAGAHIVGESSSDHVVPPSHTVTVESRTTIAPEPDAPPAPPAPAEAPPASPPPPDAPT